MMTDTTPKSKTLEHILESIIERINKLEEESINNKKYLAGLPKAMNKVIYLIDELLFAPEEQSVQQANELFSKLFEGNEELKKLEKELRKYRNLIIPGEFGES